MSSPSIYNALTLPDIFELLHWLYFGSRRQEQYQRRWKRWERYPSGAVVVYELD